MVVYLTMQDETIAPILYRTGRGDRWIPLVVAGLLFFAAPVLAWWSGPFFWPWGLAISTGVLLGGAGALRRWTKARRVVLWDEAGQGIEFRGGSVRRLAWSELTRVVVTPSAVRTRLWVGSRCFSLSHRLVKAESLLDKLRAARPDLFPLAPGRLVFHRSSASAVLQLFLALGTAVSGWLLFPWQPWVGGAFVGASVYVVGRILFSIPRCFEVDATGLTTRYWLRWRRWGLPQGLREEGYAAGGAVFFRMVLEYPGARVVLDEGQLTTALRPLSDRLFHLLRPPIPV